MQERAFLRWLVGALHLLSFPVGTALGIYAFWVLLNKDTAQFFAL